MTVCVSVCVCLSPSSSAKVGPAMSDVQKGVCLSVSLCVPVSLYTSLRPFNGASKDEKQFVVD